MSFQSHAGAGGWVSGVQAVERGPCALGLFWGAGLCTESTLSVPFLHGMLIISHLSGGGEEVAAGA